MLGDIPSLREHWEGAAVFVAPDDPEALRSAIDRLIDRPSQRAELAGAHGCGPEFTVTRMTDAYQRLYDGLLAPSDRRRWRLVVDVVIFCHSLVSDWNHGNAHFLRGVA